MFGCGYRTPFADGRKQKFVRLEDSSPRTSMASNGTDRMNRCGFQIDYLGRGGAARARTGSLTRGVVTHGSEGLRTIGRSLRSGVSMAAVFQEDLKNTSRKIFDPQGTFLVRMNRAFVISCILAIAVDPMFFYLPMVNDGRSNICIGVDRDLAISTTVVRTIVDLFYVARIVLQFRTAYIAPSSRVFGRGELVIDPAQIARRYLRRFFAADLLSILPLPQLVIWKFLHRPKGVAVLSTKNALLVIVFLQYVPRLIRLYPLSSELKRTSGVFAETAFAGAAYYLLWYLLASHIVGAFWYLLSIERVSDCWKDACDEFPGCNKIYMYCGNDHQIGFLEWRTMTRQVINETCEHIKGAGASFNYGIYSPAVESAVIKSHDILSKLLFCLWWGLANLSTLGQGLQTSIYTGEALFSISLAIFGLILMALLIGNMQTYLQSLTVRLEEMRVQRRDSEQWMHHRLLPQELRERVRRYGQYKWLNTHGVDEESLVQNLPKDLRRDIKRHLCLGLVRRVPLFANMDERLLDAICERLKPSLYTEHTYIIREGDPVDQMLFIIRGLLESITTDGGRSGFFNRSLLREGDFCGEELLTWALDPKAGVSLPSSTRTVMALSEVEAFALRAEELKFVAAQFRRLHSKQVQHTFRFYSQQWRTWAASFIQAAWRRRLKRKLAELRRKEEEVASESSSLKTTILVSRFAANALRGVHRQRSRRIRELMLLPKPPEPDFGADD